MRHVLFFTLFLVASLAMCTLAFLLLSGNSSVMTALLANLAASCPLSLLVCVIDYQLIRRIGVDTSWRMIACYLSTSLVGIVLVVLSMLILEPKSDIAKSVATFLVWNSILTLGMEIYLYHRRMLEKEALLARLEKEKAAYQFEALKQQLNPHFLFNSLNALASLAYQDAEKTNLFVKKLSAVYRYLLQTADKPLVTLREELSFLRSYLYLEEIRFGSAMQISIDVPQEMQARKIVPASLQLLVENAFKHNIATESQPLRISVKAEGDAIIVKNRLQPRGDVLSNKKGLKNLAAQFEACGREIKTEKGETSFSVALPLFAE